MAGYQAVIELRRLEEAVDKLGFMLCSPKTGWGGDDFNNLVGIKPRDNDVLPIYARDAEIFRGTLEQLQVWIRGVAWAREYDSMLKISDDKKRTLHEDRERRRIAEMRKREQQKKILGVLKASDRENGITKK